MSSRLSIVAGVFSATAALLVLSSCNKTAKVEARAPGASEAPTVAVAKATTEDLSHGLVLTAEFKPFQEVEVMAKVAGYVKKIYVDVGDRVQEGHLLAISRDSGNGGRITQGGSAVERSNAEVARAKDEITAQSPDTTWLM